MLRATWLVNSVRWDPIKLWGLEKESWSEVSQLPLFYRICSFQASIE